MVINGEPAEFPVFACAEAGCIVAARKANPLNSPAIVLVVAVAANGVIGRSGDLPWRMPSDLKRFREMTLGRPVIMGRRTFESIGRPLDGRVNIVVTRCRKQVADGIIQTASVADALAAARRAAEADSIDEIMVIGGAKIYRELLPLADRIYLTRIEGFPDGDTYFPALDTEIWRETGREALPKSENDEFAATLIWLERIEKSAPRA